MLVMIRSQSKDDTVKHSLEALLGQVDAEVWLGEITIRILHLLEKMLLSDNTSNSYISKLGRTLNISKFYYIENGKKNEVSFFEIYRKKNLTKNVNSANV
jgi:hypothetical protein